jgi:hypothetical protein
MKPVIYVKEVAGQRVTLYEYESCYVVALDHNLSFTSETTLEAFPQNASSLDRLRIDLQRLLHQLY